MTKEVNRKILAAVLSLTLILSLTACNNEEKATVISPESSVKTADKPVAATMDSDRNINLPEETAPEINTDDFDYTENDSGEIIITGYKGIDEEIVLPVTIEGKPVVQIGYSAFADASDITKVTIPEGIRDIDNAAFMGCGIKEITIPSTVKRIGGAAFRNCPSLETVIISEGVETIDSGAAFMACPNLSRVDIPQSLTSIGSNTFLSCDSLKEITISDSTVFIGQRAFEGCKVTFKGNSYSGGVYDNSLYIAVNGAGYDVPNGIPPSA